MTRKTRGVVVALASVVLVVAAAGAAFGFTDDASAGGTTFVTAANALQKAGCASGFGDGSFGYNANVTRGQDAIFQIACASGIAYVNNAGAAAVPAAATTASTPISTVTFTAGINPGGLQYILVRGEAVRTTASVVTPVISVTPPAGGTASSPPSQTCRAQSDADTNTGFECEAGFIVPTGQALTITFSASGTTATQYLPGTLAVNSAPRGNTATSGTLS